ncbi:hypothetical protein PWT90_08368 [Aphanocladium album]|nr:hypothetical protein PWT90_08368 [Aphanocladium album]
MKFLAVVAALASVAVATDVTTTVICPSCQAPASTNDIVTRTDVPKSSCDSPPLTVVKTGDMSTGVVNPTATGSETSKPTSPPIAGAAGRVAGGALAAVVAVVALL